MLESDSVGSWRGDRRLTRRLFGTVLIGGIAGLYLGARGEGLFKAMSPLQRAMRTLRLVNFKDEIGAAFQLRTADRASLTLQLESVEDNRNFAGAYTSAATRSEIFTLTFRGPVGPTLEQGTYRLYSNKLGAFDLFLVPANRRGDRAGYHALINRPVL